MAFENARISQEEYEAYHLGEIDARYTPMNNVSSDWTIDRERNIHMRTVSRTVPPDMGPINPFRLFFWKNDYVMFECKQTQRAKEHNNWCSHQTLVRLEIPENLRSQRSEIVSDIEEALKAYRTGGIYSKAPHFKLKLSVSV